MTITCDKLIKLLRKHVDGYATHKTAAEAMEVNVSTLSLTLGGHRAPSARVLAALGYERVVRYEKVGE